jgi:hypothetical protein
VAYDMSGSAVGGGALAHAVIAVARTVVEKNVLIVPAPIRSLERSPARAAGIPGLEP